MAVTKIDVNKIVLRIALHVEDIGTEPGFAPVLSGDLRKSIKSFLRSKGVAVVGSNLPYARAVHDGRPAITIRPNVAKNPPLGRRKHKVFKRARLKFTVGGVTFFAKEVRQKKRKANPFLLRALRRMDREGYDFIFDGLIRQYGKDLVRDIKKNQVIRIRL